MNSLNPVAGFLQKPSSEFIRQGIISFIEKKEIRMVNFMYPANDGRLKPRFRTAYMDPFAEIPILCLLCSYFNKDGELLNSSPEYTLHKANKAFTEATEMTFEAMGELKYYVISDGGATFIATDQRGYQDENLRKEIVVNLSKMTEPVVTDFHCG
jgi:glutamine synthetase